MQRVSVGQPVRVRPDQRPDRVFTGTVEAVAGEVLAVAPPELAGTAVAVRTDLPGPPRPARTSYEVRVRLDDADAGLRLRGTGVARVRVTSRPLAARLYRGVAAGVPVRVVTSVPRVAGTAAQHASKSSPA